MWKYYNFKDGQTPVGILVSHVINKDFSPLLYVGICLINSFIIYLLNFVHD